VPCGTGNPCDLFGEALQCEKCVLPARFIREVPVARTGPDYAGLVFLMTIRGVPGLPVPSATHEVLCEHHIHDWQYGPGHFG
jgi:hypothetical protein